MTLDCEEQAWWTFRISDTSTVYVPADTEDAAKRILRQNTIMKGKDLAKWERQVDELEGRSRWTTRDTLKREALK